MLFLLWELQLVEARGSERTKLSMLRRKVAERLVAAKNETAMLTTFNEVNMTPINLIRNEYKDAFKAKHGGLGLGYMSFFTKAVTRALAIVSRCKFYDGW